MKNKIISRKCTTIIFLVTSFLASASGKIIQIDTSSPSITVTVIIQDTVMLKDGSLEFKIYKDGINSMYSMMTNNFKYNLKSKETKLVIPLSTTINYAEIGYGYRNEVVNGMRKPLYTGNNLFILEAGDDIQIILSADHVNFKGKGNEKYNCMYEVAMHRDFLKSQGDREKKLFSKAAYAEAKSYLIKCADSLYQLKLGIIKKCIGITDHRVYNLMLADAWAQYNSHVTRIIFNGTMLSDKGDLFKKAVQETFETYSKKFKSDVFADSILAQSFQYCDFLFWKEQKSQSFFKKLNLLPKSLSSYVSNSIQNNYEGLIKDKLILISYFRGMDNYGDSNESKLESITSASNNLFKTTWINFKDKLRNEAFPFELSDENGLVHKLSDFKGKLVIIDFWFTGCHGCIQMAKSLKPIIAGFKNEPKIVFISISVDGDKFKHLWLESLKNEIYSGKDQTNLLASDADQSGIIKHYNILAYPKLVVISKEGRTISVSPPDPRIDSLKFRNFLHQHLNLL